MAKYKLVVDELIPMDLGRLAAHFEIKKLTTSAMSDPQHWRGADGALIRSKTEVTIALLEASGVKFVGSTTVGMDHIKASESDLKSLGIKLVHAPNESREAVVAWTLSAMLELMEAQQIPLSQLAKMTVGIVGVGNIGSRMASISRLLGVGRLLLCDPILGQQSRSYQQVHQEADILLFHPSYHPIGQNVNHHLIHEDNWRSLKEHALIINASRGAVTANLALKAAKKAGQIGGLALDVFEHEPDVDQRLIEVSEIATPHIAGHSMDGKHQGADKVIRDAAHFFGIEQLKDYQSPIDFRPSPEIVLRAFDREADLTKLLRRLTNVAHTSSAFKSGSGPALARFGSIRKSYTQDIAHQRRDFSYYKITISAKGAKLAAQDVDLLKNIGFRIG